MTAMRQDDVFKTEGDQWFQRNQKALEPTRNDVCMRYLTSLPLSGKRVLEVGTSNGYRLARLAELGAECSGTDISAEAVADGTKRFPHITLSCAPSHDLSAFEDGSFDLVLVSFVLHWVDRSKLLQTVAEIDRVLKEGGFLVIQDFDPPEQYRTDYHHLPGQNVFTYKQPYWDLFTSSRLYVEESRAPFDHADTSKKTSGSVRNDDTCALVALRKRGSLNYPLKTLE